MNAILSVSIKVIIALIFSLLIGSCEANNKPKKDLPSILRTSFDRLFLAENGLESPYTEDDLNDCIERNYKPCLDIVNVVEDAKKTILSLPADEALDTTLDIIKSACLSQDEATANITCYGGIMSLYFYHSPKQDTKILARIKKYPKEIRNLIFNDQFYWYYNRPTHQVWIDYLSIADIDWEDENQKRFISDMFNKSIDDLEKKHWIWK